MTKENENDIKKFEQTNNLGKIDYIFATTNGKGMKIFGKVTDDFLRDLVFGILADNPQITEILMDGVFEAVDKMTSYQQSNHIINKH